MYIVLYALSSNCYVFNDQLKLVYLTLTTNAGTAYSYIHTVVARSEMRYISHRAITMYPTG